MPVVNSLQELKSSINWISALFFVAVTIVLGISAYFVSAKLDLESRWRSEEQIQTTWGIFQSTLSEQLSIIANADRFIDFLRSGSETRKHELTEFEYLLSQLHSKAVLGMQLKHQNGEILYKSGEVTDIFLTLNLCYVGRTLDKNMGVCRNTWTLFFSPTLLVDELMTINESIKTCDTCKEIMLMIGPKFGSFPVRSTTTFKMRLELPPVQNIFVYCVAFVLFFVLVVFSIWNRFWVQKILWRNLADPIERLTDDLNSSENISVDSASILEIKELTEKINIWKTEVKNTQQQKRAIELGQIAAQVAHDLESPINALKAISEDLANIPESHRVLLRGAAGRIQGMSRKFLDTYADKRSAAVVGCGLVSAAIDSIVLEKQAEYTSKNVTITTDVAPDGCFLFAKFNQGDLKEVLSNVINNSIEATPGHAEIKLRLYEEDGMVLISIKDNGSGMSSAVLKNIFKDGVSYGKNSGSGLGLFHAKTQVEAWGGSIDATSEPNCGTTVVIRLHKGETPKWFPIQVTLAKGTSVVILDDDDSFRLVLEKHIADSLGGCSDIDICSFAKPEEMIDWAQKQKPSEGSLFLIDHEFQGSPMNGIQVIKFLKLEKHAILITSRFEEEEIQKECKNSGIMLTSKAAFPRIPVVVIDSPDMVLLDDDPGITITWKMSGFAYGKSVLTFNRACDFFAVLDRLPAETPICVDFDLNDDRTGEEVLKIVYEGGHQNLFLSTGFDPERFKNIPWIKRVVGKNPPVWGQDLI